MTAASPTAVPVCAFRGFNALHADSPADAAKASESSTSRADGMSTTRPAADQFRLWRKPRLLRRCPRDGRALGQLAALENGFGATGIVPASSIGWSSFTNIDLLMPWLTYFYSVASPSGFRFRCTGRTPTALDSGVFEFSFRDERYMPFEGAGALSDWELARPRTLRVFDYNTVCLNSPSQGLQAERENIDREIADLKTQTARTTIEKRPEPPAKQQHRRGITAAVAANSQK